MNQSVYSPFSLLGFDHSILHSSTFSSIRPGLRPFSIRFLLMERSTDARTQQCTDLFKVLGDKVSYVSEGNYNSSMGSYWSSQEANLVPKCIVSPRSVDDVAAAIKTLYDQQLAGQDVSFAIRGGGHTPWAGSANIQDGVTIDMRAINGIEVSDDLSVTYVGAGAIWGDVYKKMDSLGLVVVGGRLATIGVGGLLTGGLFSILP